MLLTVPHGSMLRNVLRNVRPVFAAVARDLHDAIACAGPDKSGFFRRFRDREHDRRVLNADVVAGQAAGKSLPAFVV